VIGALALLGFVSLERAVELPLARRHTRRLLARGAYEVGAVHYPAIVALHVSWLATLWFFGWDRPLSLAFVAFFAVLEAGRFWVLRTLGARWTTRIIVLANEAPIVTGPYRFVRHPNYLVVALEMPCVPLALGLGWVALFFGGANLAMLAWRIRCEDRAYAALASDDLRAARS
jgi:methyltransferase